MGNISSTTKDEDLIKISNDVIKDDDHISKENKIENRTTMRVYHQVMQLLQIYEQWIDNNDQTSVSSLFSNHYQTKNIDEFICKFLDDYDYIINNIDKHQLYIKNDSKCTLEKCLCLKRCYRNTHDMSQDNTKRISLYHGFSDETEIVLLQHLDIIHNTLYHVIDRGLRYYDNSMDENQEYCDKATDIKLKRMKENIIFKRKMFDKLRGYNNVHDSYKHNKFVTHFHDNDCKHSDDISNINEKDKYTIYSAGVRYYYHKRYRNIRDMREMIPGTNLTEAGNTGYKISDWFIEPIYNNLKTELLKNDMFTFSIQQWNNTTLKAKLKWNKYKNIYIADQIWFNAYGYRKNSIIKMGHIICLLLYTNYDCLCTKFSETFRKYNKSESVEELKRRHSNFANFGKGLRECIELFGTSLRKSGCPLFYHGINKRMLFKRFSSRFCSPTSTSTIKGVAMNFGADGIILTIQNSKVNANYFNCVRFSDFPAESEMLFIAGATALEIIGLSDLSLSTQYDNYVRAIKILQQCLDGRPSQDKLIDEYHVLLSELIDYKLSQQFNNLNKPSTPQYVKDIFGYLLKSFTAIFVDVGLFKQDPKVSHLHGYTKLAERFIDSSNFININVLHRLVPQINDITIYSVERTRYQRKYIPSVKITEEILWNIYSVLHLWKLKHLSIRHPLNGPSSLKSLISKYYSKFAGIGYKLQETWRDDVQRGSCVSFEINRIGSEESFKTANQKAVDPTQTKQLLNICDICTYNYN